MQIANVPAASFRRLASFAVASLLALAALRAEAQVVRPKELGQTAAEPLDAPSPYDLFPGPPPCPAAPLADDRAEALALFRGNTVFADACLAAIVAPVLGSAPGAEAIERARLALTRAYVGAGYPSSGALVPLEQPDDGRVAFDIVEGRLVGVRVREGAGIGTDFGPLGDLDPGYVRRRLEGPPGAPLNTGEVEERVRLLLRDPLVEQVNGRLVPGAERGEALLDVDVGLGPALTVFGGMDNFDPRSTGVYTGTLGAVLRNSTGQGDALELELSGSRGRQEVLVRGDAPLGPDASLFAEVDWQRTKVIEAPFDVLDIESGFLRGTLGAGWDAVDRAAVQLRLDAAFDYERSVTDLLGQRFSLSPGQRNGEARAAVLRLGQRYVRRAPDRALSLSSTVSLGLDALGATENPGEVPDGKFASWLGQGFYVRRFDWPAVDRSVEVSLSLAAQVASARLLAFEQVALSGADAVRGFRESAVADDNLGFGRLAVRTRVARLALPGGITPLDHPADVLVEPFVSAGTAWPHDDGDRRTTLVGAGVDFTWSPRPEVTLAVGMAGPLASWRPRNAPEVDDLRAYVGLTFAFSPLR